MREPVWSWILSFLSGCTCPIFVTVSSAYTANPSQSTLQTQSNKFRAPHLPKVSCPCKDLNCFEQR